MSATLTDKDLLVMATKKVIGPNRFPVRFAFREESNNKNDSGWRFYSGHETKEEEEDPELYVICPLSSFVIMQTCLKNIVDSPVGSVWEKSPTTNDWEKVEDYRID